MKHTDSVDRIFNTNIKKKKKHWRKIKLHHHLEKKIIKLHQYKLFVIFL